MNWVEKHRINSILKYIKADTENVKFALNKDFNYLRRDMGLEDLSRDFDVDTDDFIVGYDAGYIAGMETVRDLIEKRFSEYIEEEE
tara:strand:+ start:773 stop:1030 length:258 start_codon:yes stop_codon:yes gene_type:complete